MLQMLVPLIGAPHWFATPENKWEQLIHPHLADWLVVPSGSALENYHEGRSDLYMPDNYRPWLRPLLWWGTFVLALIFVMQCINSIMRRQWTDNEKLSYPLIQLPVEMTRRGGASVPASAAAGGPGAGR